MAEGVGFEPTVGTNPQRFSRPSHSAALAPFRLARLSASSAKRTEELLQQLFRFACKNAMHHGRIVVEARVRTHVVEAGGGAGLQVCSAVHQRPDS